MKSERVYSIIGEQNEKVQYWTKSSVMQKKVRRLLYLR